VSKLWMYLRKWTAVVSEWLLRDDTPWWFWAYEAGLFAWLVYLKLAGLD
jgi:hypothetical protein